MQSSKNDKLIRSEVGELEDLIKKGSRDLESGKADQVTLAYFHEGETVEVRGLKFKISSINQRAKRLTLKML